MGAFGDKLRREREMRGITLSEISESTKVSKRWLQALEDEQFEQLPGGVFNRGFVRAYARFLGINDEQAIADYIAASNEQEPPDDKFPLEIHEKKSDRPPLNPRRSFVPILLAMLALVLVVGGWTVWVKRKPQIPFLTEKSSGSKARHPASATVNTPKIPGKSASQTDAQPANAPAPLPDKSSDTAPEGGTSKDLTSAPLPKTNDFRSTGDAQSDSQQLFREERPNGSFNVVIKAKKDSWISITADGQPLWEGTLKASKERSVQAGKKLMLKTGNAAGIDVSYNGKPLGTLGKEKEVRTITFNTAGLQQ